MDYITLCSSIPNIGRFICVFYEILSSIIPVLVLLGVVYFVWGVVQYMIGGGEEAKEKGKDTIIYGLIGLTSIASLWGLVKIVVVTFGLDVGIYSSPNFQPLVCPSLSGTSQFQDLLGYITCLINNSIIPLIFALAVAMLIWGTVKFFIIDADEEAKREEGKQFIIWGIIALAAMLSIWGLVTVLSNTFGVNSHVIPQVQPPVVP
jgi:hypothetical protein